MIHPLVLMHIVTGALVRRFGLSWAVVLLNPLRELFWWWILFRSMFVFRRKGVVWRGRSYPS